MVDVDATANNKQTPDKAVTIENNADVTLRPNEDDPMIGHGAGHTEVGNSEPQRNQTDEPDMWGEKDEGPRDEPGGQDNGSDCDHEVTGQSDRHEDRDVDMPGNGDGMITRGSAIDSDQDGAAQPSTTLPVTGDEGYKILAPDTDDDRLDDSDHDSRPHTPVHGDQDQAEEIAGPSTSAAGEIWVYLF